MAETNAALTASGTLTVTDVERGVLAEGVETVFLGGGTPSLMPPETVAA